MGLHRYLQNTVERSTIAIATGKRFAEAFCAIVRMVCLTQRRHCRSHQPLAHGDFLEPESAREKVETWCREYAEVRVHGAIGSEISAALMKPAHAVSPSYLIKE